MKSHIKTNLFFSWILLCFITTPALISTAEQITVDETEKKIIAIRVVDNQQQPIQGAVIRLDGLRPVNDLASHYGHRDPSGVEFITGSDGIAQVEYPRYVYERVETGAISFHLSHPDYADMRVSSYKIDGSEGPVVMSPGAELVAVALLNGVPVREFTVLIESSESKSQIKEGTDGRLIQGIKEGTYPIYFSYIDGTGREYYSAVEIFEAKAGMSHQIELPLYPALSLKGILDPSIPRPIKNGRVQVNMINETKSMEGRVYPTKAASVHRTFTADVNPDGSFLFPQLPRGYGEIIAICDGFVSKIDRSKDDSYFQNQHFDLQSDEQEIVVEMEPTATFSGKVVNADGQAIGGVKVVFSPNVFWGNFISQLFMGPPYKDIQRELKSRDLTEVPMDKLQELMLRYTPSATTDAKGEFSVVNLPGHRRESYIVWSANYELHIETVENRPPRREREVDLSPGEEISEVIQVVPKGQDQIETFGAQYKVGDLADFALRNLDGKEVKLSDFKGKVVLLNFWATWCPPCIKEIPHFIELYKQYKVQGFEMVGISVDKEGIDVVRSFVEQHEVNYPILMGDRHITQLYGGISSIPTTFLIDKKGRIRKQYAGYRDKSVFEADIKASLAGTLEDSE